MTSFEDRARAEAEERVADSPGTTSEDREYVSGFRNGALWAREQTEVLRPFRDLFELRPDSACSTTFRDGIECVVVPAADLQQAFTEAVLAAKEAG